MMHLSTGTKMIADCFKKKNSKIMHNCSSYSQHLQQSKAGGLFFFFGYNMQVLTFCISGSIECDNDLIVAKYHLQASSASAVASEEPTEEGWKGKTMSAGKMFDLPSERTSNWTSASISNL